MEAKILFYGTYPRYVTRTNWTSYNNEPNTGAISYVKDEIDFTAGWRKKNFAPGYTVARTCSDTHTCGLLSKPFFTIISCFVSCG